MNKIERQKQILQLLTRQGQVDIAELCQTFDIVAMTARRDLNELAQNGQVVRTHGGAILQVQHSDTVTPFTARTKLFIEEKASIADSARSFVTAGQRIFLASGSTVHAFAQTLDDAANLTVVTNAINVAYQLSTFTNIHLLVLGGETRPNSLTLTGALAEKNLDQLLVDAAFIGINALDAAGNFYASSIAESAVLQTLFTKAAHIYILADASKLDKTDFVYLGTLSAKHTLITTAEINDVCRNAYHALGTHIVIA